MNSKNKTYFIFSDVHGDYDALVRALKIRQYDPANSYHQLVSLGDNFGRSDTSYNCSGSRLVYEYLTSKTHKNKPKCLMGNHEDILLKAIDRGYLTNTDFYNGEHKTVASFAGVTAQDVLTFNSDLGTRSAYFERLKQSGVYDWMKGLSFYCDIDDNFRCFHGWQPLTSGGRILKHPDAAGRVRWIEATWANLEDEIWNFRYLYPNGWDKTLVFGHWGTYRLRNYVWDDGNPDKFGIWWSPNFKLVGIDGSTYTTHKLNILVIENGKIVGED